MSIIKNSLRDKYTQLPNSIIEDPRLSDKSLRVLIYLFSKNSDWKVYNKDIQNKLNIKQVHTLSKCWKELIDLGYLVRERQKSKGGKISGGYIYHIVEEPQCGNNHNVEEPQCGNNHNVEEPTYGENHILNNTRTNSNTEYNNKTNSNIKKINKKNYSLNYTFNDFWDLVPKYHKKDSRKCKEIFDRVSTDKRFPQTYDDIRRALIPYITKVHFKYPYIKNMTTWLNSGSYADEWSNETLAYEISKQENTPRIRRGIEEYVKEFVNNLEHDIGYENEKII